MKAKFTEEIQANLKRADESLSASEKLFNEKYFDFASSRAYYASFYAITALLLSEKLEFGKHSGVISAFHQHFVKTGKVDKQLGRDLNWLFELRNTGDYGVVIHVKRDEAKEAIRSANEIVRAIKRLIK